MDEKKTLPLANMDFICQMVEKSIPFNKLIGVKVEKLTLDEVRLSIAKRDDLVGNYMHGILHGGVIASVLDVAGGLTAMLHLIDKLSDAPPEELVTRLTRLGTIDMRVDYLRPGRGECFTASSRVLRIGDKVAVIRMEFTNETGVSIAVGTGTYMVG